MQQIMLPALYRINMMNGADLMTAYNNAVKVTKAWEKVAKQNGDLYAMGQLVEQLLRRIELERKISEELTMMRAKDKKK